MQIKFHNNYQDVHSLCIYARDKKKVSEASVKHAGVGGEGVVGRLRAKRARKIGRL